MFSICFMLILIKEFETEQTVRSRWPYKCEISKLFYLPQTPPVNSFKLIPASERLPTPTETPRKSPFSKYLPSSRRQEQVWRGAGMYGASGTGTGRAASPPAFAHTASRPLRAGWWISCREKSHPGFGSGSWSPAAPRNATGVNPSRRGSHPHPPPRQRIPPEPPCCCLLRSRTVLCRRELLP